MKLMPKKVDSQFLVRIIRDEVSTEEREYFEQWLTESDANKEEYAETLLVWEQMGKANIPQIPDRELQWQKISGKITEKEQKKFFFKPVHINREKIHSENIEIWITRIAAVILLAVVAVLLKNSMSPNQKPAPVVITKSNIPSKIIKYELVAGKGERITLPLSDGSVVYLNSDTKIVYPKQFEADYREVEVTGEAYFIVSPDKHRPFTVKTGQITTLVTGTEFNVVNRNNKVEVVVASGKIKVFSKNSGKVVEVQKGQKVFASAGQLRNAFNANLDYELAWRDNKLAFSNTRLSEIMDEIERNYNVNVVFKNDSLKSRTLTGVLEGKSLDQVLSLINLTLDLNIRQQGLTVIVE
jgi:ferric-dicitrate binding protein FerR (iron transport regulator)